MLNRLFFLFLLLFAPLLGVERLPQYHVITVQKSGTHLLLKFLGLIRTELTDRARFGVSISHFSNPKRNSQFLEDPIYHKLVIVRDLRDVLISAIFHVERFQNFPGLTRGNGAVQELLSKQTLDEKLTFLLTPGHELFDHIQRACSRCAQYCQTNDPLIVRFENLIGPSGGGTIEKQNETFDAIFSYLGVSPTAEEVERIRSQLFGNTLTFRKGQIGGWKEVFRPEHLALFDLYYRSYNEQLGYWY